MDEQEREVLELKRALLESRIQGCIFKFMSSSAEVQRLQLEHAEVAGRLLAAAAEETPEGAANGNRRR